MTSEGGANTAMPLLQNDVNLNSNSDVEQKNQRVDEYGMPIVEESLVRKRTVVVFKNIKSRKQAILNCMLHIPALAVSLGVLTLTFRNVFWTLPSEKTNNILNALQFAAQAHGSLMIASLSAILLHLTHVSLASRRGAPLGFVSSSFQLNSIGYLIQPEFISLPWRYILTFLLAFSLALLSSPSSAIVIIPRLQFWPIRNHWYGKGNVDFSVYIERPAATLFAETLTEDHVQPKCLEAHASLELDCPSNGMRHWLLKNEWFTQGEQRGSTSVNGTIQNRWLRYMNGRTSMSNIRQQSQYFTSTLLSLYGDVLFAYQDSLANFGMFARNSLYLGKKFGTLEHDHRYNNFAARYDLSLSSAGKTISTRKPLVKVECAGFAANTTALYLFDRWKAVPGWALTPTDYSRLITDLNSTNVNSSIINVETFGDVKPSLGVFYSMPEAITPGPGCPKCTPNINTNYSMYTCAVITRWAPARVFSDASYGDRGVFDFNPDPLDPFTTEHAQSDDPHPQFYLSEDWAKAITVPWIDSLLEGVPSNRTMLDIIGQKCLDANTFFNSTSFGQQFEDGRPHRMNTDPMKMLTCLQQNLAITIAEAISRIQDPTPVYFVANVRGLPVTKSSYHKSDALYVRNIYDPRPQTALERPERESKNDGWFRNLTLEDFHDPARFTEIYMPAARWGYGYGFHESKLIYFGTAILLFHCLISLIYIIWILSRGEFKHAGWSTIGGLVSMAMKSGTEEEKKSQEAVPSGWGKWGERKVIWKRRWAGRVAVRELKTHDDMGNRGGHDHEEEVMVLRNVGKYEGKESDLEVQGKEMRGDSTERSVSS